MKNKLATSFLCILIALLSGCAGTSSADKPADHVALADGQYVFVVANRNGEKVIESINGGSPALYADSTVYKVMKDFIKDAEVFAMAGKSSLETVAKLQEGEKTTLTVKVAGGEFSFE